MIRTIRNRWTDAVIWEGEAETVKDALHTAIASGADLRGAALTAAALTAAALRDADLSGADLSGADLTRAVLTDAVLTGAVLTDAALTGAVLTRADLTGAVLTDAALTGAVLTRADLTGAVLTGADLTGAVLTGAVLRGAVLTGAVLTDAALTGAVLTRADLTGAVLTGADLTDAALTGAVLTRADGNKIEIPVVPQLATKMLAAIEATPESFDMGSWHGSADANPACETTHCRAGWYVHLAGQRGYDLEEVVGTAAAGALIVMASCPFRARVPNFYASNHEALDDIRADAAMEAQASE